MSESDSFESRKRRSSRLTQPQPDPLTCPRCESTNTKFCYYNNYNKTQPRYFCKSCKRHWTNGGILRNVPAGGGRKNKRLRRPAVITTTTTDQETYDHEQKSSFFGSTSGEKEDDESYTDLEELKALVDWDLPFTRLLSPFDANPCSYIKRSFIEMFENDEDSTSATSVMMSSSQETSKLNWDDLDALVLDDLNKPWEDPTFKT